MFILSMKLTRKKKMVSLGAICLLVAGIITLCAAKPRVSNVNAKPKKEDGATSADIVKFLEGFGWEVGQEPTEIAEILIPAEFNDVYQNYNDIQKQQGYDLEKFRGKTVKRYTFQVLNYPEHPENIQANVLVFENQIIGGDIDSVELDGFMHGFAKDSAQASMIQSETI